MKFTKMHGAGNDYIYVNCVEHVLEQPAQLAIALSDRHFGIGSDGLICICSSEIADFKMEMYNADGSYSPMCGNGIRCVGKYVYDKGLTDKTVLTIETGGDVKTLWLNLVDGQVETVRVCMGSPVFAPQQIPILSDQQTFINQPIDVAGSTYHVTGVSVGNPHAVLFVPDVSSVSLEKLGPLFEEHVLFPKRINTEFVQVIDRKHLKMRVWERGSGETLACGTGATASLVAAVCNDLSEDAATVSLLGGDLYIEWDRNENLLYMTGPATTVFEGDWCDKIV